MSLILAIVLAVTGSVAGTPIGETAKISSASVYYDRKEGFAYFNGKVHVDDAKYQLHADRAYVFMSGTNDLKRIVALGNVAMTNENKRAYGAKVSYYRAPGMVVLCAEENGSLAEVREESEDGVKVVRGKKIKFWTDSKQVEVIDAEITAPSHDATGGVKGMLGR